MENKNPLIPAKAEPRIHLPNLGFLVATVTCDLDPGLRRDER